MCPQLRTIPVRRAEIQAEAASLGIDEAYIANLVDSFYDRIRSHDDLGPIFARHVRDWEPHLLRMKAFWSAVALNSGRYSGKPVPAHIALRGVREEHFDHWLALFEETLEETAPSPGAVGYFMERAQRIAESLRLAMFGLPAPHKPQEAET